jgi:uncharacterized protein (TIGR02996 family)
MSDREGLLAAIAADPSDDVPRLVLADWLEERGDPLGEFIRLQMVLEPLRTPCDDPAAELERNKRLHGIPPGGGVCEDQDRPEHQGWEAGRQLKREAELLEAHKAAWLGEAAPLLSDPTSFFTPQLRRGFIESAGIGVSAFLRDGDRLRRGCPMLRELVLFGSGERWDELSASAALAGLDALTCRLDRYDASRLSESPHLQGLRSLTVWVPEREDIEDLLLWSNFCDLEGLQEVRLLLPRVPHEGTTRSHGHRRPEVIEAWSGGAGPRVTAEYPHHRRWPLDGLSIGMHVAAGRLRDGRAALIDCDPPRPVVVSFDGEGDVVDVEQLDLGESYDLQHTYPTDTCWGATVIEVLKHRIGFEPGPIFVTGFLASCGEHCIQLNPLRGRDAGRLWSALDEEAEFDLWHAWVNGEAHLWLDRPDTIYVPIEGQEGITDRHSIEGTITAIGRRESHHSMYGN